MNKDKPILDEFTRIKAEVAGMHVRLAELKSDVDLIVDLLERFYKDSRDTVATYRGKHARPERRATPEEIRKNRK